MMDQTKSQPDETKQIDRLGLLAQRHLDLESAIVEALDDLNSQMSALLTGAGVYGPRPSDMERLEPLVNVLQQRFASSKKSRLALAKQFGLAENETASAEDSDAELRFILGTMPPRQSAALNEKREQVHNRLVNARQELTANQAVIFYSMEFHRRYLLGVLQCDTDESNYQADGQAFKLPPEKLFGRSC